MAAGGRLRAVTLALCAWAVLVIVVLVVSGGAPTPHDWYAVLAIGAAASIGLVYRSWRT